MKENGLDVALEELMDRYSVYQVLSSIVRVCVEKASYVADGGSHGEPSPYMAGLWRKLAKQVEKASNAAAGL